MQIWFWQTVISPHVAGLAKSLADAGHSVTFLAEREMSPARRAQGWSIPSLGSSCIVVLRDTKEAVQLARNSPPDTVHICQGIRGNGLVAPVQKALKSLRRKQFVLMETVDESGWLGFIKRAVYKRLFHRLSPHLAGVLASGSNTRDWVVKRGVPAHKVFSFAYFLPETAAKPITRKYADSHRYRVLFVGRFIECKRLDLLISAISRLESENVELAVVGSGPLENQLKQFAEDALPGRVEWIGRLPMDDVGIQMAQADCLVLPSRHDGWGAVVSEALMSGTPAICSDACGAAVVAEASGHGGVFKSGSVDDLAALLETRIAEGRLTCQQSQELAEWSRCLGGQAGARYLISLLEAINSGITPPQPPWFSSLGIN